MTRSCKDDAKPGPGRPRELDELRSITIGVRLTQGEWKAFEKASKAEERELSVWLRRLGRKACGLSRQNVRPN